MNWYQLARDSGQTLPTSTDLGPKVLANRIETIRPRSGSCQDTLRRWSIFVRNYASLEIGKATAESRQFAQRCNLTSALTKRNNNGCCRSQNYSRRDQSDSLVLHDHSISRTSGRLSSQRGRELRGRTKRDSMFHLVGTASSEKAVCVGTAQLRPVCRRRSDGISGKPDACN
jgi:hypothetical protein